jgi:hypothetical protein
MTGPGSGLRRMRLDEFLDKDGIPTAVVEQFDDYSVDVALPSGWEPFQSPPGARVCIWRADPSGARFFAYVVLTMTQAEAVLDPAEVFSMLCQWQLHTVPGTQETSRDLSGATEGPGVVGTLGLQIPSDTGLLESESVTRILSTQQHTLIAQLTLTALPGSPVDRNHIGLAVTRDVADAVTTGLPGALTETGGNR